MASARRKPATVALDEQRVEVELQALRQRLVEEGAAKLSAIKPKALRERVVAVLAAEGFEATSTWLRKPLAAQLDAALAHGAVLPRKVLGAHLRGATAAELQRALEAAERAGRVRRVLRGKAESLAGS